MASDKETLISMGFSEAKVVRALKATKNAGLQPAMDWLLAHADDPDVEMEEGGDAPAADGADDDGEITEDQVTAQSLKCDDCGRLLRDATAAEMHAIKTQHVNFSESTTAIKPLTEEEKKAKLEELKARLAQKKEEKRLLEIEEMKSKEKIRRKTGQEMNAIKDRIKEQDMKKALDAKMREKEDEKNARAKIRAQIEQDKKDRAARLEKEKLARQGSSGDVAASPAALITTQASGSVSTKDYTEARIQFRLPTGGTVTHTFQSTDTLSAVYEFIAPQVGNDSFKLLQTFPRQVLSERDKTLKDLKLVPSSSLVVQ
ncbi:hypothetical protein HDU97_006388 [Phlyctochytrium planicorne]|nr:hypothetical protein HDU97_006388 [Phlyctochytrium planicorne]